MRIEVAWATPEAQEIVVLDVSEGTTARQAAEQVIAQVPPPHTADDVGVFGRRVDGSHVLRDGDRVEFYRPLKADPKVVRRELARLNQANMPGTKARRDGKAAVGQESSDGGS